MEHSTYVRKAVQLDRAIRREPTPERRRKLSEEREELRTTYNRNKNRR